MYVCLFQFYNIALVVQYNVIKYNIMLYTIILCIIIIQCNNIISNILLVKSVSLFKVLDRIIQVQNIYFMMIKDDLHLVRFLLAGRNCVAHLCTCAHQRPLVSTVKQQQLMSVKQKHIGTTEYIHHCCLFFISTPLFSQLIVD